MDAAGFFQNLGISMPVGARISYHAPSGKLIVHNTPEENRKVAGILGEVNSPTWQPREVEQHGTDYTEELDGEMARIREGVPMPGAAPADGLSGGVRILETE